MTDLRERFHELDRLDAPEVWPDVMRRGPRPSTDPGPTPRRRVAIAVLALLIAFAGLAVAERAFRTDPQQPVASPTVSNGRIAFARLSDSGWQIDTINPDGTSETPLAGTPSDAFHPVWSPDGRQILFDVQSASGRMQIYVVSADGTGLTQLTDGSGWNYLPAWSPDGSRIAFVSTRDGNDEIYVMSADGSAQTRLTDSPDEDLNPSWAPSGDLIAFQSNRNGNNEIYVMNEDGSNVKRLTDDATAFDGQPEWSPDGRRIVFASTRDGSGLYTMNTDGKAIIQLTHDEQVGSLDAMWSPDGGSVVYTTSVEGSRKLGIFIVDVRTGSRRAIPGATGDVCCPSWQPVIGRASEVSEAPSSLVGEARVTATIPLPEGTVGGGVAVGSGAAWVGFQSMKGDPEPGVARIDLATNQVVATIAVDGTPWRDLIVATDQGVWVGSDGVIDRIDPATNSVVATITVGGSVSAMDEDPSAIWAVVEPSDGSRQNPELVRLDPTTDEIVATVPLGDAVSGYEDQVVSSDGSVWIMGRKLRSNDTELGGDLVQVDATSNAVVSRLPVDGFGMVVGDGQVWINGPKGGIFDNTDVPWEWRTVDIDTGIVSKPFQFQSNGLSLITPDLLWSVGYDQSLSHVRVTSFDRRTLETVTRSEAIDPPLFTDAVIDPTTRTVWISATSDVVRMDIS